MKATRNRLRPQLGFTLIELMITVAIIGILSAIAFPSYQEYVRRTARADAQSDMMEYAQIAERFFTLHNRYDQTRAAVPVAFSLPSGQSPRSGAARYNLNIAFPTSQSYLLQAVPVGGQAVDVCGTLSINQLGVSLPANGTDGRPCW